MKLEKDLKIQSLYRNPKNGIYYFRKYLKELGEVFRSLKTKNKGKAIGRMNRMLSRLEEHQSQKERPTVRDLVNEMKRDIYTPPNRALKTCEEFHSLTDTYILPFYGNYDIGLIRRGWDKFRMRVKTERPEMKLDHLRKITRRILRYAHEQGHLEGVPTLPLTRDERSFPKADIYEPGEVELLFKISANDKRLVKANLKAFTLEKLRLKRKIALLTGLRDPSEVHNLKYSFFDIARGGVILPPHFVKTREGRYIPVPEFLLNEIALWKSKQRVKSDFLFPKRGNAEKPEGASDKSWQRFKKAIGITRTRYQMRHTHATARALDGENADLIGLDLGSSVIRQKYLAKQKRGDETADKILKRYGGVK
jgi:integrase